MANPHAYVVGTVCTAGEPSVSITSPVEAASFTAPASITINATASDADGTVTQVDFYNGATLLGTDATSPYSYTWANVAAGNYVLTAKATDNSGLTKVSTAVNIAVNAPSTDGYCGTVANGDYKYKAVTLNGAVTITFHPLSPIAGCNSSLLYLREGTTGGYGGYGMTQVGTDFVYTKTIANNTPLSIYFTYNTPPGGERNSSASPHSYTVGTNCTGNSGTAPTVSVTSPANNASFAQSATITLTADAADADGTITSVEFYRGATLIGTDNTAPYSVDWTNAPAGNYTVSAKAIDNSGLSTISSLVNIIVNIDNSAGYCGTIANGDYSYRFEVINGQVDFTFHPLGAAVGSNNALIFVREGTTGGYPGYQMTPIGGDFRFTKTIANGTPLSIYFTYNVPGVGDRNSSATPHSYTVGTSCLSSTAITAAPTPTRLASNVISLFSNAYTDVAGTDWFPNWGQSTVVADTVIQGNTTKKYTNLNYQGVQFATAIDASTMQFLHIDLWTPNCTAFDVYLIKTDAPAVEQKVTLTPTLLGWNSFDIPLASYTNIPLNNIGQFKLVGTPDGTSKVYLDNIYFYKNPVVTNEPVTAAPTPTRPAANVISLFSNAYTDVAGTDWFPNWGQSTVVTDVMIQGNATKKYATMNYQGVQFASSINASSMLNVHLDLWTPNCTAFDVYLINTSPGTVEQKVTLTPTLSGWNSFDILLSQYSNINLTNIGQIKLVAEPSGTSTVYLDNIYFWTTATPPTITNFTVPAKMVGDAAFTLTAPTSNSAGAFTYTSSKTSVATISGNTVTIVGGGTSVITATQAANGIYASGSISANLVVSLPAPLTAAPTPTRLAANVISLFSNAYTDVTGTDWFPNWGQSTVVADVMIQGNATKKYTDLNYQGVQFAPAVNASTMQFLHIDLWTPNCTAFDVFLINTSPATVEKSYTLTPTLAGWNSFDIPLTAYNTIALNNIGQFKLVGTPFGSSVVYLDNIFFWKNAVIPVELTAFKAKIVNSTTVLNWQTASERDNQGFTIERSNNGTSYNAIGQVKGNGTTSVVHDYTFTDTDPSVGINYYRLRQADFNGKETLSPVVSVILGKNGLVLKGNLVHNVLDVTVNDEKARTLSIYNMIGQQVFVAKVQGTQRLDISNLATGLYIIATDKGETERFVKE